MRKTLSERLVATSNRPSGFDWLRLVLAVSVVCWHTLNISYGSDDVLNLKQYFFILRPQIALILAMFFSLSGFLVAGSLERCRSLISFGGLRIMRIFPALVVEVLLSALILGPLLTSYSLSKYFSDQKFYEYMLNMFGIVHFFLPGMFVDNPYSSIVNDQIWTVPYELRCYEVLAFIAFFGIYKRKWPLIIAVATWGAYVFFKDCHYRCEMRGPLHGNQLIFSFLCGVMLYRFRENVIWSFWLAVLTGFSATAMLVVGGGWDSISPIPAAYLTVFLGLCNPPRIKSIFSGDYSYGIFLYGFPIQQTVASFGAWTHQWYINLALALPLTATIASFSWWFVEKPVLTCKPQLLDLERIVLSVLSAGRERWSRRLSRAGSSI